MRWSTQAFALQSVLQALLLFHALPGRGAALVADYKAADVVPIVSSALPYPERIFNGSIDYDLDLHKRAPDCIGLLQNWFCCYSCCQRKSQTNDQLGQLPDDYPLQEGADPTLAVCTNTGQIPSYEELNGRIIHTNQVATKTSVFYTANEVVGGVVAAIECWLAAHAGPGVPVKADITSFNTMVPNDWLKAVGNSLRLYERNINQDPNWLAWVQEDKFQKLLSQAFAEQAQGDIWIFMPYNEDPTGANLKGIGNVWKGWEYPALTRNPKVTNIIRADPGKDGEGNWVSDSHEIIWSQGMAPSPNEPYGSNWPAGLYPPNAV